MWFNPGSDCEGFVVDQVVVAQAFLRVQTLFDLGNIKKRIFRFKRFKKKLQNAM
jgi:hypothetical protein